MLAKILSQKNSLLAPTETLFKWNEASLKLYFISDRLYFRNPKQIREHWINHLNPEITKKEWTCDEDIQLLQHVIEKGRKWALIAKLGGNKRT